MCINLNVFISAAAWILLVVKHGMTWPCALDKATSFTLSSPWLWMQFIQIQNFMHYSIASESRETESRPEASSHGYRIHQLDTRKTARVNFTYVWPTLLRKLNHKYESFCANIMIFPVFPIISTCECVDENLQSPLLSRSTLLHCPCCNPCCYIP